MNCTRPSHQKIWIYLLLLALLFLAGCTEVFPKATPFSNLHIPTSPVRHKFDLSTRQGLRDIVGDFSVREHGADTGITVFPDEKVEIFASGTASVSGKQLGPEGVSTCHELTMPESSLPCYSLIYSIGIKGLAGEVGTHAGFNPSTIGNLFLGMNAPNLASNTGVFHLLVLIIPPRTFTGLWATPESGFAVQGTHMKLSAYVFAQDATVTIVQFALVQVGQAETPICNGYKSGVDMYTCDWNIRLPDGTHFKNGPVRLNFTLKGSTSDGASLAIVGSPDGVRTGTVTYAVTQPTDIYAGYAAMDLTQPISYQKVIGRWTVPSAQCSPGETSDAAIWVGMTNATSSQGVLAQLGTESGCLASTPIYSIVWEMYPAPSVRLSQPLQPNDDVTASVTFQNGKFRLSIDVPNEGVHFSTIQEGKVTDTSDAECIVEAPTRVDDPATNKGHVLPLTNFGQVSVHCQLNNDEPIAGGPQDVLYQMQTGAGVPKASTSSLDQTGTTFTVQWHHS
jgi:hypothetical protein